MAGCSKHGYAWWAGAGSGKNRYSFCAMCRDLRAREALGATAEVAEAEAFIGSTKDELKRMEKAASANSVTTVNAAEFSPRGEDGETISTREVITGAVEDELLSAFGNLCDLQDTDRLRDAILEINKGSMRGAASKYGLDPTLVFRIRTIIEFNGPEAGVEKLLAHIARGTVQKKDEK